MDLISVIVPVYNVEKYLYRCVDSILAQTYTNLEIILVDDGSPDNCGKICDEYAAKDSRVKVIHQENGGVSSARNAGLKAFTGDYVTFIDSDDFVDDLYVESLASGFKDDVDIVVSTYRTLTEQLELIDEQSFRSIPGTLIIDNNFDFSERLQNYGVFCKLFRKGIVEKLSFNNTIFYGEDTLFNAQAYSFSKSIRYIPECCYNYVIYSQSLSHGAITEKKVSIITAYEKIINIFPINSASYRGCVKVCFEIIFSLYGRAVLTLGSRDRITKLIFSRLSGYVIRQYSKKNILPFKLRLKYAFLTRFRWMYNMLLIFKEPFCKHYK